MKTGKQGFFSGKDSPEKASSAVDTTMNPQGRPSEPASEPVRQALRDYELEYGGAAPITSHYPKRTPADSDRECSIGGVCWACTA